MSLLGRLELGVGVRADLAVEVDLFVLRGNPFHVRALLERNNYRRKNSMNYKMQGIGNLRRQPDP